MALSGRRGAVTTEGTAVFPVLNNPGQVVEVKLPGVMETDRTETIFLIPFYVGE